MLEFKLLLILIVANGIPVILHRCFGALFSKPVDAGLLLADGHPLLGYSKTWRGLLGGIIGATVVAILFAFPVVFAVTFALFSLLGDLLSSFIKRRMKRAPSSKFIGVDQIPEAIFPLVAGTYWLDYGLNSIVIVTLSFFLIHILTSPVLALLGLRKHPH